jgi:hypothetical protein
VRRVEYPCLKLMIQEKRHPQKRLCVVVVVSHYIASLHSKACKILERPVIYSTQATERCMRKVWGDFATVSLLRVRGRFDDERRAKGNSS